MNEYERLNADWENSEELAPQQIEERSFAIIDSELVMPLPPQFAPLIKRVIHTTADFDYADNLYFSPDALDSGLAALRDGATVVTDTNMARAGVNAAALQRLGCRACCFMAEPQIAERAAQLGQTRAALSMERAAELAGPLIFAIGNAPTALLRLLELYEAGRVRPALVIGAPVGFVNVVAAKQRLLHSPLPRIVARGRKGGSNVAAALVNALLYLASPRPVTAAAAASSADGSPPKEEEL